MAVFNEPQKWAQTLGKDADVVTIPNTAGDTDPSIDKIFPAVFSIPLAHGGKAIPRSVLNGLFKLLGDWSFYQQNGGIASYSNTFDYAVGSFVKYNNELYLCIQANGTSSTVKAPTDAKYWLRVALNNDLANYLPLAGGNLTGSLNIASSDGESILKLDSEQGSIYLDASSNIRGLFIKNVDNKPKTIISIEKDGTATFNGTALNAQRDINGRNIADTYLPLTGGALTGNLNIASSDGESILKLDSEQGSIYLDASSSARGLFVKNVDNKPKTIIFIEKDGTATFNGTALNAQRDSNGRNIADTYLPLTGGALTGSGLRRNVDNSLLRLSGGIQSCAGLALWGSASNYSGYFMLDANNGANVTRLQGTPTGALTWGNVPVACAEIGTDYIRLTNGLQICWGIFTCSSGTSRINFSVPFINLNYSVSLCDRAVGVASATSVCGVQGTTRATTGFTAVSNISDFQGEYIVIGKWK